MPIEPSANAGSPMHGQAAVEAKPEYKPIHADGRYRPLPLSGFLQQMYDALLGRRP